MRKIIIIGNGFDRAHNIKTSYKDFIKYIIEQSIAQNKDVRENLINVGYLHSTSQNYEYIRQNFNFEKVLPSRLTDSPTSGKIHFKNELLYSIMSAYFEADWVDIEEIYFKELSNSSTFISDANYVGNINKEFEQIKIYLETYLSYLIKKENIKTNQKFIDLFEEENPDSLLIINFNYTPIAGLYLNQLHKIKDKNIIHIHGELNSKENPIIFGYGDDTNSKYKQLINQNNNLYLKNFKRLLYKNWDSYDKIREFINAGKYKTCTLGHSLGLSDKTLLKEIFEHKNLLTIKLFRYEAQSGFQKLINNLSRIIPQTTINKKVLNYTESSSIPQIDKV